MAVLLLRRKVEEDGQRGNLEAAVVCIPVLVWKEKRSRVSNTRQSSKSLVPTRHTAAVFYFIFSFFTPPFFSSLLLLRAIVAGMFCRFTLCWASKCMFDLWKGGNYCMAFTE